jgi:hypothetical protein
VSSPVHRHVHPLEPPHQQLELVGPRRVVEQEIVAHPHVGDRLQELVALLEHGVRLELAGHSHLVRLDVGGVPVAHHVGSGGPGERGGPHRREMLVEPDRDVLEAGLLQGHAGGLESLGRNGVAEDRGEEVVGGAVEVVDLLPVELLGDGRRVEVVDPVMGGVRDLVVFGVGIGWEEVVLEPELVRVDIQHRREPPDGLQLAVRFRLGPGEPVPVHVEAVGVAAGVELAAVRVLDREDHHGRRVQDGGDHAVVAVGQLVQGLQRGVGAALLVPVHVRRDPQDLGRGGDQRLRLRWGECGVTEGGGVGPDRLQRRRVIRSSRPTTA